MKKLFSIIWICFIMATVSAQGLDHEKLNNYFETLAENNKLMGSITMANEGKIIYQKAFGYANIDQNIPLSNDSRFRVGSITKMFTAALILKAIEEGKIRLDETIEGFFPELKNSEIISISQLMNHRSGIHSFTSDPDYLSWNTEYRPRESLYGTILKGGSDFEPDTNASYSNSNYVLLTWILEDLYKESYPDLLSKYITGPLQLRNTYMGKKTSIADHEVFSYKFVGEWIKESETDMSIPLGAGAIVSTTADLTKFIEGLFAEKIISAQSLESMKEMKDNYGRGMFQYPFHDRISYGHTGGIDEFRSMLSYFPEEKLSLAIAVNGSVIDVNQAAITALNAYFGNEFEIPVYKNITLTSEDLDKYLGIYGSPTFPLKITITKENNILKAQATGQPSFALEAEDENIFSFSRAGLTLEFNPEKEEMTLKQGGGIFVLQKIEEN